MAESRKQKREFCDGLKLLEARLAAFEKDRNAAVFGKKSSQGSYFGGLEEHEHKLSFCRKAEKLDLQEQIRKVRTNVSKLHRKLSNVKPTPQYIEQVKSAMEEIEGSVLAFKEKQRKLYEELLNEEEVTSQEIVAFEKKMQSWSKGDDKDQKEFGGKGGARLKDSDTMPPAIMAFEKFLQSNGGHNGGWDEYDHQVFLKQQARSAKDQDSFLQDLSHQLPARTVEDLKAHLHWYAKYKSLLSKKKEAIIQWKENKKPTNKRAPLEEEAAEDKETRKAHLEKIAEKEREEKQAKLQQWKAEQQRKRFEEEEEKAMREKELLKAEKKEKQRQMDVKKNVEKYVERKEQERKEQRDIEEAWKEKELEQKKLANKEIERFRERDMRAVEDKLEGRMREDREKMERERKLDRLREKVRVEVSSDPSRLHKLTEGLEERRRQKKDPNERGVFSTVRDVPHRSIPSWRQGV